VPDPATLDRRARVRFVVTAAGVVVAGGAGYLGFVAFVDQRQEIAGVLTLAAATGFAAFFSPCSFPLMLSFLGRRVETSAGSLTGSVVLVAGGAATFLAMVALVVAVTGGWFAAVVNFASPVGRLLRVAVAGFLLVFGARQVGLIRIAAGWLDRVSSLAARALDPSGHRGAGRDFLYGFGYLLAGFG
jgi:cytochrome c biogenesis protein CcdA